jgi:hypothetical protein
MYKLTNSLNAILKTSQQRLLLDKIKPFIPVREQALFDHLASRTSSSLAINSNSETNDFKREIRRSSKPTVKLNKIDSDSDRDIGPKKYSFDIPKGLREVEMRKNRNENFGFTFSGYKIIVVDSVEPNSIADRAGLYPNDIILSVNNFNIENAGFRSLLNALSNAQKNLILEVSFLPNF